MKRMNRHVINTKEQIENTLLTLSNRGLARITKHVEQEIDKDNTILTWSNHVSGRHNSGKSFTTIRQYISIYESGAYHAILLDGSIIRVFFKFKKNILTHQSLLYWPAPVVIPEEDIEILGIRSAIEDYLCYECEKSPIKMRSPFRLDFDSSNSTDEHPATHLHMQHADCRISTKNPFIKFIFKNFYPDNNLYIIQKLPTLSYSCYSTTNEYIIKI